MYSAFQGFVDQLMMLEEGIPGALQAAMRSCCPLDLRSGRTTYRRCHPVWSKTGSNGCQVVQTMRIALLGCCQGQVTALPWMHNHHMEACEHMGQAMLCLDVRHTANTDDVGRRKTAGYGTFLWWLQVFKRGISMSNPLVKVINWPTKP